MKTWIEAALAPSADPWAALIASVLLGVFVLASARLLLWRPSRWPARLLLQALALLLVWRLLCPPLLPLDAPGRIDLLGAGWQAALTAAPDAHLNPAAAVRALPEAQGPLPVGVAAAADFASVLRLHPGAQIRLIGEGVVARDQDAARGRLAQWLPAPLPAGLTELSAPAHVAVGAEIVVRGVWRGAAPVQVQLQDAAGAVLASHTFDSDAQASQDDAPQDQEPAGRTELQAQSFALTLPARVAGELPLDLIAIEPDDRSRTLLRLPLQVEAAPGLAIGLLAGAPGAELRALRRWAVDAGHRLDSRIALSRGRVMGGAVGFSAEELAALDLLIIDERAWVALGAGGRGQVQAAVDAGLGLLLRPLASPPSSQWPLYAEQGFVLQAVADSREHRLAGSTGRLRTLSLSARGDHALPLLSDRTGAMLGIWRPRGLGRIGLLWLGETQGLVGRGEAAVHARLWAQVTSRLARARSVEPGESMPAPLGSPIAPMLAFSGERAVLCGLSEQAVARQTPGRVEPDRVKAGHVKSDPSEPDRLDAAETAATALSVDARGCAALWPRAPGLHLVASSAGERNLQVLDAEALPSLQAAQRADTTRALLSQVLISGSTEALVPGPAWPWLPPLLAALGPLWWLERRRPG